MIKNKRKKNYSSVILTIATVILAIFALLTAMKATGIINWSRDGKNTDNSETIGKNTSSVASSLEASSPAVTSPAATSPAASTPDQTVRIPGKLNPAELERLDNKTLAWWIKLNGEHRTPETTPEIVDILAKHNGYYTVDTSVKKVYLTFDEGYENGFTPKILDSLKENNTKAMFFITSGYLNNSQDLVKRMVDEGHVVGNHSVNHKSMPSITDTAKFEAEIEGLSNAFKALFGQDMTYFRPPMGEYSIRSLEATSQLGYKTVFWSFAYQDWYVDQQKGADYAYDICMRNIHNGAIYLLHAVSKDNADALDRIIKGIKAQGYEIGDPSDI